jgi:hypothetical protein
MHLRLQHRTIHVRWSVIDGLKLTLLTTFICSGVGVSKVAGTFMVLVGGVFVMKTLFCIAVERYPLHAAAINLAVFYFSRCLCVALESDL